MRVRFSEPVTAASVRQARFALSMGGEALEVTSVKQAADGAGVELRANRSWPSGTAGIVRVTGALTDRAGNTSKATRGALRVWASPGDFTRPSSPASASTSASYASGTSRRTA